MAQEKQFQGKKFQGKKRQSTATDKKPGGARPESDMKMDPVRRTAMSVWRAVFEKKQTLDTALDSLCAEHKITGQDRAFCTQIVKTAVRRHGQLAALVEFFTERPLPEGAKDVHAILHLGLTEILFMRTSDHAAVNENVNLLSNRSSKFRGLVNAILRRAIRGKDKNQERLEKWRVRNLPLWLHKSWQDNYGADRLVDLAAMMESDPTLDISVKDQKTAAEWAEKLDATLLPTGSLRCGLGDVRALEGFEDGDWWVQDMSAALPVRFLGDVKGKKVLDLCAAPGGKTMQLASMGADVTAIDRSKNRLKRLHENLKRTHLDATVVVADALTYDIAGAGFEYILLDAPCSATGTYRRNPDVLWTKGPEDVAKLVELQQRLLDHAFAALPVGGALIYCVCSLESVEGVDQITDFLAKRPNAKRQPITADEVGGLDFLINQGDLLALPCYMADKGGMDGFYAARITKASD